MSRYEKRTHASRWVAVYNLLHRSRTLLASLGKGNLTIVLSLLVAGCTAQDAVYHLAQSPKYIRAQSNFSLQAAPRWLLPTGARLHLQEPALGDSPNTTQHPWQIAARRGLDKQFTLAPGDVVAPVGSTAQFVMNIEWPMDAWSTALQQHQASLQANTSSTFWPSIHIPRVAKMKKLNVHLRSIDGVLNERLELRISPRVWDAHWHDSEILEEGFTFLAERLTKR